jgi:hypothetical protein
MKQRADSEKLMIRYLLGDVPEDEQIRIEERFFTDDEYFEQLLALEDDLIDDYVNGELTDREREQFEEYFLASPTRRQRVEFAKTFMRAGFSTRVGGDSHAGRSSSRAGSLVAECDGLLACPKSTQAIRVSGFGSARAWWFVVDR